MPGISKRLIRSAETTSLLNHGLDMYRANPYHVTKNPDGIIDFGTAENQLMYEEIHERLAEVDLSQMPVSLAKYNNFTGNNEFRDYLARFVNHYMKPTKKVCPNNLVVYNGADPAMEGLAFSFCDPNEGILIQAPFYGSFKSNLSQRSEVKLCEFYFPENYRDNQEIIRQTLKDALERWQQKGVTIRAMIVINPNNPTGLVYSPTEMRAMLEFCYEHNLHLIVDEIYFLSIYDESVEKQSILSIDNFEKYQEILHVVWAFSKDFSLSGFRCGVLITFNKQLYSSICEMSLFSATSSISQHITQHLIDDFDWVEKFLGINHKRLRASLNIVTNVFDELNIKYVKPSAGLFTWFNLNEYMNGPPSEEQDRSMFHKFMQNKLFIGPGFAFYSNEPGWFRIIFSIDVNELKIGMNRFREIMIQMSSEKKDRSSVTPEKKTGMNGSIGTEQISYVPVETIKS